MYKGNQYKRALSIVWTALALITATIGRAETADEAFEKVMALLSKESSAELGNKEKALAWDKQYRDFLAAALAFGETYPEDKGYWNLIVQSGYTPPLYVSGFKPGIEDADGRAIWGFIERDQDQVDAFKAEHKQRLELLFQVEGLTERVVGGAYGWWLMELEREAWQNPSEKARSDYREMMHRYWAALPENPHATTAAESYLRLLGEQAPDEVEAFKAELLASSNPELRDMMSKKAEQEKALTEVAVLSFTALDGQQVDLGKMRGKVILVDFWATWCGPCIAELPNVKAAYQKYHSKGFEIIGVSLDRERDEQKLKDFVADNEMPWPQYFDGEAWKGELVQKYGIKGIPAMILIGPDGEIASTNARGEALAPAIESLLGI